MNHDSDEDEVEDPTTGLVVIRVTVGFPSVVDVTVSSVSCNFAKSSRASNPPTGPEYEYVTMGMTTGNDDEC